MSFFGFDTTLDRGVPKVSQDEDLAVYTFGEEGYDDLAAALDEGLDELNDETFGDTGALSKDFDYTAQAIPQGELPVRSLPPQVPISREFQSPAQTYSRAPDVTATNQASRAPVQVTSIEKLWSDPAPVRAAPVQQLRSGMPQPSTSPARFIPFEAAAVPPPLTHQPSRVLTLEEVEAEQRAAAQLARMSLAETPRESPRMAQNIPPGRSDPSQGLGYAPSPLMQQAIPSASDLDLLRQAQQQQQQQHARQLFAQQHQQRQQELYDQQQQQQQLQRGLPSAEHLQPQPQQRQQPPPQRPLSYSSPQVLPQQAVPPPRFAQQQTQGPPPPQNPDVLSRMHILDSLNGRSPLGLDQVNQIESNIYSLPVEEREAVMNQAMNKIVEAERMEEKRRRRMHKIADMSKYNDIMTQSDKDFITRIQVSQLVTQDPYAEDFYAQVYGAIHQSRTTNSRGHQKVLSFGDGGGIGVVQASERRSGRRENALNRMQTQIERIVNNAKKREAAPHANLQGALGKISGRSYKAAPRQLLQVSNSENGEDAAKEVAKQGRETLAHATLAQRGLNQHLSKRQALLLIENLYDMVLNIEQLRRDQPPMENEAAAAQWIDKYNAMTDQLWVESRLMAPVETQPHPLVSLLEPGKGKRLLPRLLRHLDPKKLQLAFTVLIACFQHLDVIQNSPYLDQPEPSPQKRAAEQQFEVFLDTVIPALEMVLQRMDMQLVGGFLALLMEENNILEIAKTPAGAAMITILMNRVTELRSISIADPSVVEDDGLQSWTLIVEIFGQKVFGNLRWLFPSERAAHNRPPGANYYIQTPLELENSDLAAWNLLAQFSINATPMQQQLIITELREKILDSVVSVKQGWIHDEMLKQAKLRNVNCLLNALGLDAAQISL